MTAQTNQRIDGKRLWDSLMSMAEIGATPKGGVRRLTLTDVDRRGRDRFRAECEAAGLTVRVDAIGNMFARRPGRDPNRLPVLFGSHLDSQPSGGKFDGALGVLAGLEVMHTLNDLGHRHRGAAGTGELDRRGGQPVRPLADGLGRVVRRLLARQGLCADRRGGRDGAAPRWTASAIAGRSRPRRFRRTRISSCISSRGRSWSARRSRSASSPARRRMVWYDAVVDRAGLPRRHHAALGAQGRAGVRGADHRPGGPHDARAGRGRPRHGRAAAGLAEQPQRGARRGAVLGRVPPPVRCRSGPARRAVPARGAASSRATAGCKLELTQLFKIPAQPFDPACVDLVRQGAAKLGYRRTRDRLRRRARRGLCGAARADRDDLHAVQGRAVAQRGGKHRAGGSRGRSQVLFEAVLARANRIA